MFAGGAAGNVRRLATVMTTEDHASPALSSVEARGDEAKESLEGVEEGSERASSGLASVNQAALAAGAGLAGVATAAQRVFDRSSEARGQLALVGARMDKTNSSVRALATSMSDASFETQDVVQTMDQLSQLGVRSADEMENVALSIDLIADATNTTASSIAEQLAPQVQALDGDLSALEESADAFTFAADSSQLSVEDLGQTMERLDPSQLEEMNVQSNELAIVMGMLSEEQGYTGRRLRTELNSAIEDTDGSLEDLLEEVNLSEEEFQKWHAEVGEGSEMAEDYAERVNETHTAMDELRVVASDLGLRFGQALQPFSAAVPIMQAAGGAALFYGSGLSSAVVPATVASTAAHTTNTAVLKGKTLALGAASRAQWLLTASTTTLTKATWAKTASLAASTKATLTLAGAKGVLTGAAGTATTALIAMNAALGPIGWAAIAVAGGLALLAGIARTDLFGAGSRASAILGRLRGGLETTGAAARELGGIVYELARITATLGGMALLAPFAALLRFPDLIRDVGPTAADAAAEIPSHILAGLDRLGPAQYALPILGPLLLARDIMTDPERWLAAGRSIPGTIASGISDRVGAPVNRLRGLVPRARNAAARIPPAIIAGLDRLGPAKYALPIIGPLLLARDMVTDPSRWISAGRQIPSMIASGIRETASAPVDAVTGVVGDVRDRLPYSPAVAGPLQDLDAVGPSLVSTVASGVEGEAGTLASAMESTIGQTPLGQAAGDAAAALGDATAGGSGTNIEVTVNQENHINAAGDDSGVSGLASSAQEIADLTIEEIVDALARETDYEPT